MKRIFYCAVIMMISAGGIGSADENRWNLTIAVDAAHSGGDMMGGFGAELCRNVGSNLEVGFTARAQSEIGKEYSDALGRVYHLESGYGALLIKPKFRIGKILEIGFPLESGSGLLQYRYGGEERENLRWTEEIIDRAEHSVYSAGIEPKLILGTHRALSLGFGYRGTGPLRTSLADSGELTGFWTRMAYTHRF